MSVVPQLAHLVNVPDLQQMADAQYRATGIPVGIVSAVDNSIVVGAGWQDICIHFHRANDESRRCCEISDDYIKSHLKSGQATAYKCLNGLWDIGIPIFVAEQHLATLFLGQFFYEGEVPDRDFFEKQAEKFGFDVPAYLDALDRVPIFSRDKVDTILAYNTGFAGFISSLAERAFCQIEVEKELQVKQAQLQQTQKMEAIGTLAGGVAHDFNNILSAIIGYTELAMLCPHDKEKVAQSLEMVLSAADRAKDLTRQILAFSRKGTPDGRCEPIEIHEVVLDACQLLRKTIPATIDLVLDVDTSTGVILTDTTQVHQVIMNLCTNAFHSLPEGGGRITVVLRPVDGSSLDVIKKRANKSERYAELSISDTGHGMSEEVLARIFEPFFTTKDVGRGTGMGLSVVHGIVKQLGGEILVESRIGEGTTFIIYLPLLDEIKDRSEPTLQDNGCLKGDAEILLVDDEEALVGLGKATLENFGYRVTATTSPLEAVTLFAENPQGYDLVITDQTMPRMTGDILLQKIIELRPDIPVIICTGHSDILDAERAAELGAWALLMKPMESRVLLREVKRAVAGR